MQVLLKLPPTLYNNQINSFGPNLLTTCDEDINKL